MPEPNFYLEEFTKELEKQHTARVVEGFTSGELAQKKARSRGWVSKIIRDQVKAGILEVVGKKKDGARWEYVYRMKKKEKE